MNVQPTKASSGATGDPKPGQTGAFPSLALWFVGDDAPELEKTEFKLTEEGGTMATKRSDGTAKWTNAAQALCRLLLEYRIWERTSEEVVFGWSGVGERKSAVASLNYALTKPPYWLSQMFRKAKGQGTMKLTSSSPLRRFFHVENPSMNRKNFPKIIRINSSVFPQASLSFYLDGKPLLERTAWSELLKTIEPQWREHGNARTVEKTDQTEVPKEGSAKSTSRLQKPPKEQPPSAGGEEGLPETSKTETITLPDDDPTIILLPANKIKRFLSRQEHEKSVYSCLAVRLRLKEEMDVLVDIFRGGKLGLSESVKMKVVAGICEDEAIRDHHAWWLAQFDVEQFDEWWETCRPFFSRDVYGRAFLLRLFNHQLERGSGNTPGKWNDTLKSVVRSLKQQSGDSRKFMARLTANFYLKKDQVKRLVWLLNNGGEQNVREFIQLVREAGVSFKNWPAPLRAILKSLKPNDDPPSKE